MTQTLDEFLRASLLPLPEMSDADEEALIAQLTRKYEQAEQDEYQAQQEALFPEWLALVNHPECETPGSPQEIRLNEIEDFVTDELRDEWCDRL